MFPEGGQVQLTIEHKCGHAGPAFGARNRYAVDIDQLDPRKCANCLGDFGGRNILTFPAKCVADAVDKIEETTFILPHKVTGTKPGVTRLEHAAEDLFL